ncbi:hypothetical protein AMECASPLE_038737 [Ameca splendens]|uniref:Uncharacterized protein n=1 Tax=Ameca splendens TaxID=208324 RepID=A0ABV0ZT93_9TELE
MTQTLKYMGGGYANVFSYHLQCDLSNLKWITDAVFSSTFSTFERQVKTGMQKCSMCHVIYQTTLNINSLQRPKNHHGAKGTLKEKQIKNCPVHTLCARQIV